MSFNGSGTFVINSAGQPVVANTVISATVFNALTSDLATGLSTCITKDGQTTITANIPFGSNKITGLGAGTVATDAANLGQVQSTAAKLITVTGTDTITGTMSPVLTAYAAGQLFYFISNGTNTGAMTINIDGLGAKAITRDGSTALIAGDVVSGEIVVICYDGTRFQMINAANSFGNTTINGTLTVTGDTALQANVSVTSALTVNGTFGVTGAATLGSTLSVAGKSDLPTVSTASMNAAVAVVTTGTVTNLTSTSASIASMNAGVALLTTATVTTLTASGASIASANIGNLQFTAASIASINAGVAVITNLTATGASIASANVGTAVITTGTVTNLTLTSASVASANAGVALITTGTVTNLTSTSASIASANVGTAVITTGTLTNLTATSASVASANLGVALVTTGTVNNLTSTGASIASANLGNAVISSMTLTGASVASVNVGTATITGNLTLNGGTANGVLYLDGSKVATSGTALVFDGTNLGVGTNAPLARLTVSDSTATNGTMTLGNNASYNGTLQYIFSTGELRISQVGGTSLGTTFYTGGSERMRIANAGNVGIATTTPSYLLSLDGNAARTIGMERHTTSNTAGNTLTLLAGGATSGATDKNGGTLALSSGTATGVGGSAITFSTATGAAAGTSDNSPSEKMRITATGNVGIGTNSPSIVTPYPHTLDIRGTTTDQNFGGAIRLASNNGTTTNSTIYVSTNGLFINNTLSTPILFFTNNTERARILSGGQFLVGLTSAVSGEIASFSGDTSAGYGISTSRNAVLGSGNNAGFIRFRGGNASSATANAIYAGIYGTVSSATAGSETGNLVFYTNATETERMRIDSSGNLGLGVTPSAWGSAYKVFESTNSNSLYFTSDTAALASNAFFDTNWKYKTTGAAGLCANTRGTFTWFTAASGTAGNTISFTQAMTLSSTTDRGTLDVNGSTQALFSFSHAGTRKSYIYQVTNDMLMFNETASGYIGFGTNSTERARITSGGNFGIGTASPGYRLDVFESGSVNVAQVKGDATDGSTLFRLWQSADSGDSGFVAFLTQTSGTGTVRGSIDYNRAGGLVRYNTTSDYRAKDVYGLLENTGSAIDALKVYVGKMKGATQERPMLIAHEAQEVAPYAVSGVKDEENEDGTPKYQQMDHSSLVPLLIAEIQSLRARVAQLESK